MDNIRVKKILNELMDLSDEYRKMYFGTNSLDAILKSYTLENIERHIVGLEYGDVFIGNTGSKAIYMDGCNGKVYFLSTTCNCPQEMPKDTFMTHYNKTGVNVADELRGLLRR